MHYHIIFYASKDCKDEYGYLPDANLVADFQKKNVAVAITKEGQSSSGWLRNGAEQPIPFKNGAEVFQTMKAFKVGKEECKKGYKKSPNGNFVTCQRA